MFNKLKTGVLALIMCSTAFVAFAQKKITEGEIQLSSEYHPTPDQEAIIAMLPTSTSMKFKGNFVKFEIQNGPANVTIIQDFVNYGSLTLVDVPIMQKQLAIETSKEAVVAELDKLPKYSNFKATGEKSTIAGFNAEKHTYQDEQGNSFELWTTQDIELPAGIFGPQFKDIKGTLVKYTTTTQGIKVTQMVKGIKENKIGDFSLKVPSGYEVTTMEGMMSMFGQ